MEHIPTQDTEPFHIGVLTLYYPTIQATPSYTAPRLPAELPSGLIIPMQLLDVPYPQITMIAQPHRSAIPRLINITDGMPLSTMGRLLAGWTAAQPTIEAMRQRGRRKGQLTNMIDADKAKIVALVDLRKAQRVKDADILNELKWLYPEQDYERSWESMSTINRWRREGRET